MKTVVDRHKSTFKNVVINDTFKAFAQDSGFEVLTCRAYRAKTKGKVETLAKFVDRLKVYNGKFDTFEELERIEKTSIMRLIMRYLKQQKKSHLIGLKRKRVSRPFANDGSSSLLFPPRKRV